MADKTTLTFHTYRNPAEKELKVIGCFALVGLLYAMPASSVTGQCHHVYTFPVVSIDNMPGKQHEQDLRKKLDQAGIAQIYGGVRAFIDFPADCHLLHLPAEDQDHVTSKIAAERRQTPCSVCIMLFMGMCLLNQRANSGLALRPTFLAHDRDDLALDERVSRKAFIEHRVTRGP